MGSDKYSSFTENSQFMSGKDVRSTLSPVQNNSMKAAIRQTIENNKDEISFFRSRYRPRWYKNMISNEPDTKVSIPTFLSFCRIMSFAFPK